MQLEIRAATIIDSPSLLKTRWEEIHFLDGMPGAKLSLAPSFEAVGRVLGSPLAGTRIAIHCNHASLLVRDAVLAIPRLYRSKSRSLGAAGPRASAGVWLFTTPSSACPAQTPRTPVPFTLCEGLAGQPCRGQVLPFNIFAAPSLA